METKELTIKIKPEERAKAKRKAWELKVYARMSVLALAAMATARLVLLTIDIIQLRVGTVGGEICLPPTTLRGDLVQAGEPYSHQYDPEDDRWRATYTTFAKVDGEWTYCGKCFVGKTKEPQGLPKA